MKLIRLTDSRWVLDAGNQMDQQRSQQVQEYFERWLQTNREIPAFIVIGGQREKLEYEDRREPDIEKRLKRIERRIRVLETK